MVTQIVYTNSNCSDVWEMFMGENKKYTNLPVYVISDKEFKPDGYKENYLYENSEPYYKVWSDGVKATGYKYFIYLQEDFILYDKVNEGKIMEYVDFLENNPEYSFVRLLKSGDLNGKKLINTLYEIESTNPFIFAMQATIWRSEDYVKMMYEVKSPKWLETDADYRSGFSRLGMKGAYHFDNEPKRGKHHHDSNVYPYIATALVKSAWDLKEYGNILNDRLKEYNIDVNKRGVL